MGNSATRYVHLFHMITSTYFAVYVPYIISIWDNNVILRIALDFQPSR